MTRCARCSFSADDLTDHAREAEHWLCIVDQRRSLTEHERQTCQRCVARVRADLADIVDGYATLEPAGITALTLLGDGSMQRHARPEELALGVRDEWPSDPLPVLPALVSWEDFIREDLNLGRGPDGPTLTGVVGWLQANLDSRADIAQRFPAFDEFASDVARLRSAVMHAAGLADDPVKAEGKCFDCGSGQLLRTYSDTGLTDEWTCGECRSVYDQTSYFLALRAHMTTAPPTWRRLGVAAWIVDRPFRTVQTWVREELVRSRRDEARRLVVWMPDVKAASDAAQERQNRRAS